MHTHTHTTLSRTVLRIVLQFVYVYQSSVPEQEFKDIDDARSYQRKFLSLIESRLFSKGFTQLIKAPTYTKDTGKVRSCLDHIYTNSKFYYSVQVDKCSKSDHSMISVIRPCQNKYLRTQFRLIRNFRNLLQK